MVNVDVCVYLCIYYCFCATFGRNKLTIMMTMILLSIG